MNLDESIAGLAERLDRRRSVAWDQVAAQQQEYDRLKEIWREHEAFLHPLFDKITGVAGVRRVQNPIISDGAYYMIAVDPAPCWSPPLMTYWRIGMQQDGFAVMASNDLSTAEITRSGFKNLVIPAKDLTVEAVEAAFIEWADTICLGDESE